MPSLGADMDRGTITEWRVVVGDHVQRGDIIAVVDTDKSDVEIEVFETGVVEELLAEPGDELPVGAPLARIRSDSTGGAPSEPTSTEPPTPPVSTEPPAPPTSTEPPAPPVQAPEPFPPPVPTAPESPSLPPEAAPVAVAAGTGRHHASLVLSPLVRHLAERLGVDPEGVTGTGVGGRVTREDVERADAARRRPAPAPVPGAPPGASPLARRRAAELDIDLTAVTGSGPGGAVRERDLARQPTRSTPAATAPTPSATPDSTTPAATTAPAAKGDHRGSMQRAMARLMTTSNREIPHYYLETTIDLHLMMRWLEQSNARRPASSQVLPAAVLLRATALAAQAVPQVNGVWRDDAFQPAEGVQLGVAISLRGGGLIAPTIADAEQLSVDETMEALKDLVTRARRATLRSSDLTPGTITVTNLGEQGADSVLGVIHPPQVALVGFGRILERPWAVDGLVGVRPTVVATLAADHRASDGHLGSRFLSTLDRLLQNPDQL